MLEAVRGLRTELADRAAEIEAARRLPRDMVDRLIDIGCFRLLLPVSHGGVEAHLGSALSVFEELARADASVAWTVMIGALAWCDAACLPATTFDALFADRSDVVVAGAFNPTGTISAAEGGYVVSGRWAFVSGCQHASWLYGNCVEDGVDGRPKLRAAMFSPDEIVIEDTWDVSGLSGTGSHHFHVEDLIVPAARTFVPLVDPPCVDATIVRIPTPALFALGIASVAIGTARGALDEVIRIARERVPLLDHEPVAANPHFHYGLAAADTDVRAARALLTEVASQAWLTATRGERFSLEQRARLRAAAVWSTERAVAAVEVAYRSGGGSAVYLDSSLQRRLRDIHALTQHFLVKRDTFTTAGAILAGQEVEVVVF